MSHFKGLTPLGNYIAYAVVPDGLALMAVDGVPYSCQHSRSRDIDLDLAPNERGPVISLALLDC